MARLSGLCQQDVHNLNGGIKIACIRLRLGEERYEALLIWAVSESTSASHFTGKGTVPDPA